MPKDIFKQFSKKLLAWHKHIYRPLPWKGVKDPYLIWVSEIILQQTRAAQAIPYYLKITERFPDVQSLAKAPIDDLLSLWQGLGYYSRARNLHFSAQLILNEFGGVFPNKYDDILNLKGVGKYTAAAISSFAFDLPYPVIDGNVNRIISRLFDIELAIDTKEGKQQIDHFVDLVFDGKVAAKFNQAIMDFGATLCLPKKPFCHTCPFEDSCQAKLLGTIEQRPLKSKKLSRKKRNFNFLFFEKDDKTLIQRREAKDIWQGLYQLPLLESEQRIKTKKLLYEIKTHYKIDCEVEPIFTHRQLLTHQEIHSIVWRVSKSPTIKRNSDLVWIKKNNLVNHGFPKTLSLFFEDYLYLR